MSSILCYWKYRNYLYDIEQGHLTKTPSFNSNQQRLHSVPDIGEKVYLVTYNERRCYLVGKIKIARKRFNPPNHMYGRYNIVGSPDESSFYDYGIIDVTDEIVAFIRRNLHSDSDKSTELTQPIPQYIQTIRELTESDAMSLDNRIDAVKKKSLNYESAATRYFSAELQNPATNYFIFDTKGGGEHGDIDFMKYDWTPSRYNLAKEGDLFIYRRPDKSSETGEFYFFGACKIGQITGTTRYSASLTKTYPFKERVHKSDLDDFKWVWKQRGDLWEYFFNQYGMNKIPKDDFVALLNLSEKGMESVDIDFVSEVDAIQAIQKGNYSVEDIKSERIVRSKQKAFADSVKLNYKCSCCVCSLRTKEFLVGSHIIPWSSRKDIRLDPSNGLCLCVLHDKAFDKGYIGIDKDYHIQVSKRAEKDAELSKQLQPYNGKRIGLPSKHKPNLEYLEYHWQKIFIV